MPAVSGIIEFHASSGSPTHPRQIASLIANSGQDYNRIGFFNTGGTGTFITINTAQDTTYIVNEDGSASGAFTASGKLSNNKYVNSASVNPNSSGSIAVSALTIPDATVRVRFTQPSGTAVTTQNNVFKAVKLNATSGVDDDTAMVSGVLIYALEVGQDSAWTLISQTGTVNYVTLTSRATSAIVHDYHVALSVIPLAIGVKKDFAFLFKTEFL